MGMWKVPLEGFSETWMEIINTFEGGADHMNFAFPTLRSAENFRFEWYAFKAKLKKGEDEKPYEKRGMYPTLGQLKAEILERPDATYLVKLLRRDMSLNTRSMEEALQRAREGKDSLDEGAIPIRRSPRAREILVERGKKNETGPAAWDEADYRDAIGRPKE